MTGKEVKVDSKDDGISELANIINTRLQEISPYKKQYEVAKEVGFPNSSTLSILKSGGMKLSMDRVARLAKALDLDVQVLLVPALRQYYTEDVINLLREVFSSAESDLERDILYLARANMKPTKELSNSDRVALSEAFRNISSAGK